MENITVGANAREVTGTKGAEDLRREGRIPAIIYGGKEPTPVSVTLHDIRHAIYTPNFHTLSIDLDGEQITCILKDVQFHPITDAVIHVDFLRLEEGKKVKVEVPLHLTGIAAGIKTGGKLTQKLRRVLIKATPEHLVDALTLDVTELTLGHSMRIRDIVPGEGIEILNSPSIPVAGVEIPRALKSAEAEAAVPEGAEAVAAGEKVEGEAPKDEAAKKAPKKKEEHKK